jgi:pSer/pThr/pTyr-binding forkhead associated (FHA) protein
VDEPLAVALKFGFLAVLYLFLLWVIRSALKDVSAAPEGRSDESDRARRRGAPADGRPSGNPRLEVVAAMGQDPGTTFDVASGVILGRGNGVDIRVDDPFASSAHARIYPEGQFMYIEDMGSTNGTYLNGRQIRAPERLRELDLIRIGDTEYRYEE